MAVTASTPLTHRLVDRFLALGLACVFLCVSTTGLLAWHGKLAEITAATVTLPLVLLLVGGFALRRTSRFSAAIEGQLRQVADGVSPEAALQPLTEPDPSTIAWNTVVERIRDQQVLSALEARLSNAPNSAGQQRWEVIFNALSDGLAVCHRNLTIMQANNSLAALLRAPSAADLVGKPLLELMTGICTPDAAQRITNLSHAAVKQSEDIVLGNDLAAGVLRITRCPLSGDVFGASAVLCIVRDVTQQRLADEMRSQFLSTATHELRTPLTNIVAYAELLATEADLDVEKQKSFCNLINAEATRLSRFVDQLLNVSQMEAGAISLNRHETDIGRLAADVAEHTQPVARTKRLSLDLRLPPKVPKLCVDKDKLAGTLVNLLGNATKYTPEGGRVSLVVEITADHLNFQVEDTGIGISQDDLPHLAEKFFRSSDSRVREVTGTGLGLAFAHEVARLHGGALTVTSELNKGSRFTLSLPMNLAASPK